MAARVRAFRLLIRGEVLDSPCPKARRAVTGVAGRGVRIRKPVL